MADFGEILRNIGEFGLFQQLCLVALCIPVFTGPFFTASFVFIQVDPERHCNTDWIRRAAPNLTTGEQQNLTLPRELDGTFSRCQMFVPVNWSIDAIREKGLNETTECLNGWLYGNMLYEATIVTDFDLVCEQARLVGVVQAVYMVGVFLGCLIFGPSADLFGRKRAIQIPAVILFVFTATIVLSPWFYLYLLFQFWVGVGFAGFQVNGAILCTEWIGMSKRSWGACVSIIFYSVGQCVLAGLNYAIRDWRGVQLVAAAILAVVFIYIWFIPESARWLLNRGRSEEAKKLIVKAAAINKRPIEDNLLDKITVNNNVDKGGVKVIFRSPLLTRYLCVVAISMFSLTLAVFSLHLNMADLGFNIFVTQLLFGASEMLAVLLSMWVLQTIGRKHAYIATHLIAGLCFILIAAIPQVHTHAVTVLAVTARFFMLWAISVTSVYMQELFPTSVRQTASALAHVFGKLGGILAPLLNMLIVYHWVIPNIVFSSLMLICGVLGLLLPETRRRELPDTAEEAENNQ
ncbi:solute carrier family 22 member 13-like [Mugil cephalus]|uniref:solute carrier family 22 member 13-like n=1 Tax=Mugil cephalus TaxID=48193 RepID=UPI001FB8439B|nr:solute carrier family 22 member 13-like [Mugil cephalus]